MASHRQDDQDDENFKRQSLQQVMIELLQRVSDPAAFPPVEEITLDDVFADRNRASRPPTLHDLYRMNPNSCWWLSINTEDEKMDHRDFLMYIRNFAFLKEMRHGKSFHEGLLPIQSDGFFNVWVVCRRFGTAIESFRHWTVLTQGHMFHLTATKEKRKNPCVQTGLAADDVCNVSFFQRLLNKRKMRTPVQYSHIDFSSTTTPDSIREKNEIKCIAYHVGQTVYHWREVMLVSARVMDRMQRHGIGSYDFLENNCQHFVLSLVRNIVSTQRRHIAVGGTRLEIAQWDLGFPGFQLKEWLTKKRARLLLIPTSTRELRKRDLVTGLVLQPAALAFLHYDNTIPRFIGNVFKQKTWRDGWTGLFTGGNILDLIRVQYQRHLCHKFTWKKYDIKGLVAWIGAWNLLTGAVDIVTAWGTESLCAAAATGVTASKVATIAAMLPYAEIISGGAVCYLIAARLFFARGSLTIRHMDITRMSPLAAPSVAEGQYAAYDDQKPCHIEAAETDVEASEEMGNVLPTYDERFFPLSEHIVSISESVPSYCHEADKDQSEYQGCLPEDYVIGDLPIIGLAL